MKSNFKIQEYTIKIKMTKRREFYKSSYKKVQNPGNINYLSNGKITLAHKIDREFI